MTDELNKLELNWLLTEVNIEGKALGHLLEKFLLRSYQKDPYAIAYLKQRKPLLKNFIGSNGRVSSAEHQGSVPQTYQAAACTNAHSALELRTKRWQLARCGLLRNLITRSYGTAQDSRFRGHLKPMHLAMAEASRCSQKLNQRRQPTSLEQPPYWSGADAMKRYSAYRRHQLNALNHQQTFPPLPTIRPGRKNISEYIF